MSLGPVPSHVEKKKEGRPFAPLLTFPRLSNISTLPILVSSPALFFFCRNKSNTNTNNTNNINTNINMDGYYHHHHPNAPFPPQGAHPYPHPHPAREPMDPISLHLANWAGAFQRLTSFSSALFNLTVALHRTYGIGRGGLTDHHILSLRDTISRTLANLVSRFVNLSRFRRVGRFGRKLELQDIFLLGFVLCLLRRFVGSFFGRSASALVGRGRGRGGSAGSAGSAAGSALSRAAS